MLTKRALLSGLTAGALLLITACGQTNLPAQGAGGRLKVVATTTIVADVVDQIGGQTIDLVALLPAGSDPHSFEPTPQDIARIADADLIFINGAGLEIFMDKLLKNSGTQAPVISVSDGISLRETPPEQAGESQTEPAHETEDGDPHTWIDPNNVMVWVNNISAALGRRDPANQALYQANADRYHQELADLDQWIQQQVATVPPANRLLVTDHELFGYFADRYGLNQIGTVIPGYSTVAQPSAQDLATLEDAIRSLGVKAVFVGNSINPSLEERVAADTNTRLVFLYTGSLSEAGGPASTYLDYMHYNVAAIVQALK